MNYFCKIKKKITMISMILYEMKILFQFKEIKSKFKGTRDDS